MEWWKKLSTADSKRENVRLFHCPATFRVLSTQWQASKISSLVGLRNVSIFFFSPICWLHIGERKPFVSKQLFRWRSKNHNKTPPNSEKKMIWLNAKSSRQTKVVCFNAMFFVTQRNFFFFHAGFVWMIKLEEKMFCLVDKIPAFEDCPLFLRKLHSHFSVEKKRIEGKSWSVFCVIEPFNRH